MIAFMDRDQQKRVILWCTPRSCSSAFTRAILNKGKVEFLNEKFFKSFYFSKDRVSDRYDGKGGQFSVQTRQGLTYEEAKSCYEQRYEGAELVFGKEMAVYLVDRLQSLDYIPRGYQHTFLIRSPAKSVPSLYNCLTDERNATKEFDTLEASYKPLHQLFHLIREESGRVPVLIDADDLLQNPDAIIRQYCRRTGLTFHKEMLEWDSGAVPDKTHWHRWPGWYDTLLKSSGFKKQEEIGHTMVKELPQDIQKCIETNMPYYEHLLKFRLMPEVNDDTDE